ncbi:hypothetical protein SNOG_12616 [Parastagonospora nodorum SN15]|uniref:Uncharacterized protein n=1 Tax=Phaeosphaeria nodorum (strain SN15 / ATCC MYA-4574 / FGSC 10173) TaxID=321614 RepID=Q0U6J8_PHANO|nr:hypothetical protein SNOG_12616 [Parastagonospora nodorum SN15]EAT79914.1 hypothetical protein SNOG_12616 [Parastagonospora nodorum SN15]
MPALGSIDNPVGQVASSARESAAFRQQMLAYSDVTKALQCVFRHSASDAFLRA